MGGHKIYEFDRFLLDPRERRLLHAGTPIALAPKTLDTLIVLVENAGNLLHKEVLHQRLWPNTFVEDVTLARSISDLRAILRQHSGSKFIETVPKHGYRFAGKVRTAFAEGSASGVAKEAGPVSPADSGPMIAVLPFAVFDDDVAIQVFGDGLAEELIHVLTRFRALKVAARGSSFQFRGPLLDLRKVATDLGTDLIIQGSIRKIGSRFRVTAQLIETHRFTVRWSEQFEREAGDFITIQDSIAKSIVAELGPRLDPPSYNAASPGRSVQTDAWHSVWEGRLHQHRFTPDSLAHAEKCFERAIGLDPKYSLAHLGLAENEHIKANLALSRPSDVLPRAADAISTALLLGGNSGEVNAAAGVNAVFWRYDWRQAELYFQRALAFSPSSSSVRHLYALWWLRPQGRLEEAIQENGLALTLDPLSSFLRVVQAYLLYLAGRETDAVSLCEAALGFDDKSYLSHRILGHIWQRQGKIEAANRAYATASELPGSSPIDLGYLAASYAQMGDSEKAASIRNRLQKWFARGYQPATTMAMLDLCCGRPVDADMWLAKAIDDHDPNILALANDPLWIASLGAEERGAVLVRIGLRTRQSVSG